MSTILNPTVLDADVLDIMRGALETRYAHIMTEAKAQLREAVRTEFCDMFGVARLERRGDDGDGSASLRFPAGWTEEQATLFATECLDLDLSERHGFPGQYFQQGSVSTNPETGVVSIFVRWGLDI